MMILIINIVIYSYIFGNYAMVVGSKPIHSENFLILPVTLRELLNDVPGLLKIIMAYMVLNCVGAKWYFLPHPVMEATIGQNN